jgi:hypothetical protein
MMMVLAERLDLARNRSQAQGRPFVGWNLAASFCIDPAATDFPLTGHRPAQPESPACAFSRLDDKL